MQKLEQKLKYIFKNPELLKQALTRESAIQEKLALLFSAWKIKHRQFPAACQITDSR